MPIGRDTMNRNVFILSITSFLIDLVSSSWYMVVPLYLEELGASTIAIGISFAAISVGWYTPQFLGGLLGDKIGRKTLIVISTLMFIPCYILLGLTQIWWIATLAITVFWIFNGVQYPSFNSMIAESVDKRDWEMAFTTFVFFINLSWAVGPLIGAFIIPLFGYKIVFYSGAIISGICATIQTLFLHETMQKRFEDASRVSLMVNRNIMYFLASYLIFGLAYGMVYPFISLYADGILKLSFFEIELMFSISQFAACFNTFPSGMLIKKIGSKRSFMIAILGSCFSILMWVFSTSFWTATILLSLFSVFVFSLRDTSYGTLMSSITNTQIRATVLGVAATINGLSIAIGSTIGSYLWEFYSPIVPFLLCGVLSFPSSLLLLKVKTKSKEEAVEHLVRI